MDYQPGHTAVVSFHGFDDWETDAFVGLGVMVQEIILGIHMKLGHPVLLIGVTPLVPQGRSVN